MEFVTCVCVCVVRLWEEFVFSVSSGVLSEDQRGDFSSHRSHGGSGASLTVCHTLSTESSDSEV